MPRTVGIDLGTTFSLVAYLERGRPVVIPNREGSRLTPSVVAFLKNGKRLIGQLARQQAVANPEGTIFSIKRHMGRQTYLNLGSLADDKGLIQQIKRHMGSDYWIRVDHNEYTPEEISAMILKKLKTDAEEYLGEKIEQAVISVPAYFNVSQRQATIDAATIAGIKVMRIIDEPTAAALTYGLEMEDVHTILVWDLGGGTFDVSILELGDGIFEVKAVNGDTWLGGDDYDQCILDYLAEEFQKQYGVDLRKNKAVCYRLKEMAEKAKIELTDSEATLIELPFINVGKSSLKHWEITLTRAKFEELTEDLRQKMIVPTMKALADAGLGPEDIDRLILVGGATRMPAVRELSRKILGKEPYKDIQPDEAVALGAAIQAGILTEQIQKKVLIDVTPLSLGIETQGGIFTKIIERNTPIPASQSQIFTNATDNQTSMNIHVLQGERNMAVDNMTLDRFDLTGIFPVPRGEARVEVTFDIDANGILHVSANDLYGDSCQKVRVSPRFYGLPQQELARMVEEAARFSVDDRKRQEGVKISIKADNMVRAARQAIVGADVTANLKLIDQVEEAILGVQQALASGDSAEVKSRTEALEKEIKALYQQREQKLEAKPVTS